MINSAQGCSEIKMQEASDIIFVYTVVHGCCSFVMELSPRHHRNNRQTENDIQDC